MVLNLTVHVNNVDGSQMAAKIEGTFGLDDNTFDFLAIAFGRIGGQNIGVKLSEEIENKLKELGYNVWLKREDLNHTGAHKINNALGQMLLAIEMNKTRIIAETGAGQHGVATAACAAKFGLKCTVYMGEEDIERQKLNVFRMG